MSFKVVKDIGEAELNKLPCTTGQTINVGDLLNLAVDAETWTVATAASLRHTKKAIAMESVVTSGTTYVLAFEIKGSEWIVGTANATAVVTDNGANFLLTDKATVANAVANSTLKEAIFLQRGIVGTTEVIGHIIVGNGLITTAV